jgi:hypothetical protein
VELLLLLELGLQFVLVMKVMQVEGVFKQGFQVGVFTSECAGRGVLNFLVSIL